VGSDNETLYAVDAESGQQVWAFTEPTAWVASSPTVVTDPDGGNSVDSRVALQTLGHHELAAEPTAPPDEATPTGSSETDTDSSETDGTGDSNETDGTGDSNETDSSETTATGSIEQAPDVGDGDGPGFGVGAAVTALGGAGYLLKRRLDTDDNGQ
jgi:PGF-CTERM protein